MRVVNNLLDAPEATLNRVGVVISSETDRGVTVYDVETKGVAGYNRWFYVDSDLQKLEK